MNSVNSQIITADLLSQQSTNELKKRYQRINDGRLERIQQTLQPQQRQFIELLPFLFHINHYLLPGYVEGDVPVGVHQYRPDRLTLATATKLARSFNYSAVNPLDRDIMSLLLMGSPGTIAQSSVSDLDVWCCYRSGLTLEQLALLETKAARISEFAESMGMEVHIFLMDAHKFRVGESSLMSEENAGSMQHLLLLDEFYRTAVLLAGSYPVWWLVHPDQESQYNKLVFSISDKGLLNHKEALDFGGLSSIPPGEFVGAGLWQLYKGIESPYKSVLKLLLMEVYAAGYPNTPLLSLDFKQAVFDFELDLDRLDPYVMLYRKLEQYLVQAKQSKRLELVRRCFYYKVNIQMSRRTKATANQWRRQILGQLIEQWGWTDADLEMLDNRAHWTIEQVVRERRELIAELTHSYRFLSQFARRLRTDLQMRQDELSVLGRRLSAAFDRKAGKVELVNTVFGADLSQEKITIHQLPGEEDGELIWAAFRNLVRVEDEKYPTPLAYSDSFMEVLSWCYFNGLLDAHTNIPVFKKQSDLSDYELKELISSLRHLFPKPLSAIPAENFHHKARPTRIAIYANVGNDPLPYLSARGLQKISSRNDALDFSALRENLVQSLDMVMVNSWNEVLVNRFDHGADTLVQAVVFYLNQLTKLEGQPLPVLDVQCFCSSRPTAISARVKDLFANITQCFFGPKALLHTRYIMSVQNLFYVLQAHNGIFNASCEENLEMLVSHLGQEQASPSVMVLDPQALLDAPFLRLMIKNANSSGIRVFYQKLGEMAQVYVVDEMGSLYGYQTVFYNSHILIRSLYRFLRLVEYCQTTETSQISTATLSLNRRIQFFEFVPGGKTEKPKLKPFKIEPDLSVTSFFNAQAIVRRNHTGKLIYNLQINDKDFDSLTHGPQLYTEIAKYILSQRTQGERYPCYITELHFGEDILNRLPYGRAQTIHYLQYKNRLETAINRAMENL